jgi:hypothetical protein
MKNQYKTLQANKIVPGVHSLYLSGRGGCKVVAKVRSEDGFILRVLFRGILLSVPAKRYENFAISR